MEKRTKFIDFIDRIQWQDKYIAELEEENKKLKEKLSGVTMVSDDEKQSIEHILELEKENKTMKLTLEQMENTCKDYLNDRDTLREENKELNEELDYVRSIKDSAESTIKTQDERIRFLEQCLDNKEKVNKSLREDIKWYEKEEDRLREENKRLEKEIEELNKMMLFETEIGK